MASWRTPPPRERRRRLPAEREGLGADVHVDTIETSWLVARSFDRHTLVFSMDAGTTVDAEPTPENFFSLGGDSILTDQI